MPKIRMTPETYKSREERVTALCLSMPTKTELGPIAKRPKMVKEQTATSILKESIGRNMFLVVSKFYGDTKVHLRVYEEKEDGSDYPTRKGVALNLEKWKKITYYKDDVDSVIDQ
uniref:Transcriptional coactivator p15 (PC4) C-terminal domain-containing protein n=2 Tax=Magallana gigas TaxID=29159 RepID=A0A8W8P6D9_MAGGI